MACAPGAFAETYDVYLLAGQSNMVGYGMSAELPEDIASPMPGVLIFHGADAADGVADPATGQGEWVPLRPGHGIGFTVQNGKNTYSDCFGVELSFAQQLEKCRPDRHIALIKYARGGTSIDPAAAGHFGCWAPDFNRRDGINQYDHCLAAIRYAFAVRDIDGDGEDDELIPAGIVWMQGEADAYTSEATARAYTANLKHLMDLLRAALRYDDLPVVIGRISDSGQDEDGKQWDYGDIVRAAQAEFVEQDPRAALVTSTDKYSYSDPYHYDSAGYIDLGREFADAMCKLIERKPKLDR